MAYLSINDVRSALPQVPINATSKPSEGQVDEFIEDTERYVDAVLSGIGYTTPVTGDTATAIVREIVMAGVLARTLNARDLGVRDPEVGGGSHQQRKFDRMIERLQERSDPLHLKDSTPATTKAPAYSRSHLATAEEGTTDPYFSIEDEY